MRHFIWFLDTQIKSSEHSIFCNESVVGDVMSGFKTFVVKFMIRMSKVTCIEVLHALNQCTCKHCYWVYFSKKSV